MKPIFLSFAAVLCFVAPAQAQRLPEAGYIFPAGGKAGTTIDVKLGGYDWTPDMEYFTLDARVKLAVSGPPGPILIPPPPYWFGAKGRIPALPLAREVAAKLTIPADMPPGPIYWQAANANGCTSPRVFMVTSGTEIVEDENRKEVQPLGTLPVTVSGRLLKNEEVDRYRFTAVKDGPITLELLARRLGAKFYPLVEVHTLDGRLVADATGASGFDPALTFAAKAGGDYIVSVLDIDFGGDRAHVYRLALTPGPRVLGAVPAAGKPGEARAVEFVGIGIATGADREETVKRTVTFPARGTSFDYRLETPFGAAPPFRLLLSDLAETTLLGARVLVPPAAITAVLDQADMEEGFSCAFEKGDVWSIAVQARAIGSPLDVAVTVFGPDGKEAARNDDLADTTDAGLDFTVPKTGTYRIVITDLAGKSGDRSAIYRLVVRRPQSDFRLHVDNARISVPMGGKFDLPVKVTRRGQFKGPITLAIRGLPPGITAPANLVIPADKAVLAIPLQAAADASCAAGVVTVEGTAMVPTIDTPPEKGAKLPESVQTRVATAKAPFILGVQDPSDAQVSAMLVSGTLKPRFKGQPVDQDTGRKVHLGSTFPAEVIVQRLEGYTGEVILQMAATQSYQVQGITGGEVKVPPGVTKVLYPCYMPEWLESIRTSRVGMIAVAPFPDPKGKVRWLANDITGFITMTMEGALLRASWDEGELKVPAGKPFEISVKISRLAKLQEPVRLELLLPTDLSGQLQAEPVVVPVGKEVAIVRITPAATLSGLCSFKIRATAMQDGKYPAISEPQITVELLK